MVKGVAEERGLGSEPPVSVALSRPLLSPHPLPFRCRERGVAAFAVEMADHKEEGAENPRIKESSKGVRYFQLKG